MATDEEKAFRDIKGIIFSDLVAIVTWETRNTQALTRFVACCSSAPIFSVSAVGDCMEGIVTEKCLPSEMVEMPQVNVSRNWKAIKVEREEIDKAKDLEAFMTAKLAGSQFDINVASAPRFSGNALKIILVKEDQLKILGVDLTLETQEKKNLGELSERGEKTKATMVAGYRPFALERFFAKYEFKEGVKLLCCSDCESLKMSDLVNLADEKSKQLWSDLSLYYTDSRGNELLREQICSMHNKEIGKKELSIENVIVVCPEEGIFLTALAMLSPGDHIIAPAICYQSLGEVAKSMGCVVHRWKPTLESTGAWSFKVDDLKKLMNSKVKAVFLNFPHNPTGALVSCEEWAEIVQLCKTNDAFLFSDEMYRGLEFDPNDRLPIATTVYDKGISLQGVSKTLSIPGVRIGWIISKDTELLNRVATLRDYTTICPPGPSEILALIALQNNDKLVSENLAIIRKSVQSVTAFFQKHQDKFLFSPPKAGSMCFPHFKSSNGMTSHEFCTKLVEEHNLMLLPSSVYLLGEDDPNCFRVGLGRRNVPDIINELDDVLSRGGFLA